MKVALFSQAVTKSTLSVFETLLDSLEAKGIMYAVLEDLKPTFIEYLNPKSDFEVFSSADQFEEMNFQYAITLGGDGTMLNAITYIRSSNVPVLGINLGRLGFLASVHKEQCKIVIDSLLSEDFSVDRRVLLKLECNKPLFSTAPFALNDFTLHKRDTSSMISIDTYLDNSFLNTYWADGIIVSTPTGSTGYSLACGGPIVFPGSGNIVITPVAPHNLNVRPLVLGDNSVVSFKISGRTKTFLCSLDSRFEKIDDTYTITIKKNDFEVQLLHLNNYSYLSNMREKLTWGMDKRN